MEKIGWLFWLFRILMFIWNSIKNRRFTARPVESYDNRNKVLPLKEELEDVKVAYLLLIVGTQTRIGGIPNCVRRIILLSPEEDNETLTLHANMSKHARNVLSEEIRQLTKDAIRNRVEVRWFNGLIANSMVIADPYKKNGWIILEPWLPNLIRPIFRINKSNNESMFNNLLDGYEKIWEKSNPVSKVD